MVQRAPALSQDAAIKAILVTGQYSEGTRSFDFIQQLYGVCRPVIRTLLIFGKARRRLKLPASREPKASGRRFRAHSRPVSA